MEALFARAGTGGEREAAAAAAERIRARLREAGDATPAVEMRFSLGDPWSRQLFVALCRRYGLRPFRYRGQRHTSIMLQVPKPFLDDVLWPEFQELNKVLADYLSEITDRIIRREVFSEREEAEEVDAPPGIARWPGWPPLNTLPNARSWPDWSSG